MIFTANTNSFALFDFVSSTKEQDENDGGEADGINKYLDGTRDGKDGVESEYERRGVVIVGGKTRKGVRGV